MRKGLVSLQTHPVVYTNSQEDKFNCSNVQINGHKEWAGASVKSLNQVSVGNPNSEIYKR